MIVARRRSDGQFLIADGDFGVHLDGVRLNDRVNVVSDRLLSHICPTKYYQGAASNLQISKLTKSLATAREPAHEGFDFVMDTLVCLQIAQLSERLVASRMWAFVRSLPSVLAFMGLKVARK